MPTPRISSAHSTTNFPFRASAITPDDDAVLLDKEGRPHWMTIYVGTAGNVHVQPAGNEDGDTVVFAVQDGGFVPVRVTKVLATLTTALELVGVF